MDIYATTLLPATSISHMVSGNFFSSKSADLAIVRASTTLELLSQRGKDEEPVQTPAIQLFSQIRTTFSLRPDGFETDLIGLTSDSGTLSVLEWGARGPVPVLQEVISKSGLRRSTPGTYSAKDPKNRAVLLSATEKHKVAYLFSRSSQGKLLISSPIEMEIPQSVCFGLCALDTGFENPAFLSLEASPNEGVELVKLVLDLGLNTLVRERAIRLQTAPALLIPTFAWGETPGGALLVFDDRVELLDNTLESIGTHRFPPRIDSYEGQRLYRPVAHALYRHGEFRFCLLQNEVGDFFKVSLARQGETDLAYLFTAPVASHLALLKTGRLFLACEASAHLLFSVGSLEVGRTDPTRPYVPISAEKSGLVSLVRSYPNYSGMVDMKHEDLVGDGVGQTYTLSSGVNGSWLRVISSQIENVEKDSSSFKPKNIWSLSQLNSQDSFSKYLVAAIPGRTKLFYAKTNGGEVKENVGFILDKETILAAPVIRGDLVTHYVQVTADELRLIGPDTVCRDFKLDHGLRVLKATFEENYAVIFTSSGELILLRLEALGFVEAARGPAHCEPTCLAIEQNFILIGCADSTLRVFSAENRLISQLFVQTLRSPVESLTGFAKKIVAGLTSGHLFICEIDPVSGAIQFSRTESLNEEKPLRIQKLKLGKHNWLWLCATRAYLASENEPSLRLRPFLVSEPIKSLCAMRIKEESGAESCFFFMIKENSGLSITVPCNWDQPFAIHELKLPHTARKLLINKENLSFIATLSQARTLSPRRVEEEISALRPWLESNMPQATLDPKLLYFNPKETDWVSSIVFISRAAQKLPTSETHRPLKLDHSIDLPDHCHIVDAALCGFKELEHSRLLVVSVAEKHNLTDNSFEKAYVQTYAIEGHSVPTLLHVTPLDTIATALGPFKERLLIGCGPFLKLYELGKKQLLKKNEYKHRLTMITSIRSANSRIFVGDGATSVHVIRCGEGEQPFQEIADDILPRYLTAVEILDFHTVAIADKFGNVSILRLPMGAEEEVQEEYTTYNLKWESGYLNGAPIKFEQICNIFQSSIVTSLKKAAMSRVPATDILLGSNIDGALIAFMPFKDKKDLDFFRHLELAMRNDEKGFAFLTNRDHLVYRSYYGAVKGIIDGDLCEGFIQMDPARKQEVAEAMNMPVSLIESRIGEIKFSLK